jgi:hypothetical protein
MPFIPFHKGSTTVQRGGIVAPPRPRRPLAIAAPGPSAPPPGMASAGPAQLPPPVMANPIAAAIHPPMATPKKMVIMPQMVKPPVRQAPRMERPIGLGPAGKRGYFSN